MSLAVALAMQARLESEAGAAALDAWAETWDQTRPRVELGYRRPTGADGWPFIALEPDRDVRDLLRNEVEGAVVALAVGVRLAAVDRGAAVGIQAADALVDVVLGVLIEPLNYEAQGCPVVADRAERLAGAFAHPTYEIELSITLTRPGG